MANLLARVKALLYRAGPLVAQVTDKIADRDISRTGRHVVPTEYGDVLYYGTMGGGRTFRLLYTEDGEKAVEIRGPVVMLEVFQQTYKVPGEMNEDMPDDVVVFRTSDIPKEEEGLRELCKTFLLVKPEYLDTIVLGALNDGDLRELVPGPEGPVPFVSGKWGEA